MNTMHTTNNSPISIEQKGAGMAYSISSLASPAIALVFLVVVTFLGLTKDDSYLQAEWYLYANYLLPQISLAIVVAFYFLYTKKPVSVALSQQKCAPKYFAIAMFFQVGLFSLSQLNGWFLKWLGQFGYEDAGMLLPSMDGFGFVGVFLVIAVLAATMEELVFRGIILQGLKQTSTPIAVLICGGLFSLYHQNPAQTLYQFVCGVSFAWIALRADSVLPTIFSHFLNNAVILILTKFGVQSFTPLVNAIVMSVSAVCLVLAILWLAVWDKSKKQTQKTSLREFFLYASVGIAVCAFNWLVVLGSGM